MSTTMKAGLAAVALLAALGLAGCGSAGDTESSASDRGAAPAEEDAPASDAPAEDPAADPAKERAVVYTAEMTILADRPIKVADSAGELVTGESGYIYSEMREIDSDNTTVNLALRVPAESFHDVLKALSKLGDKEISRDVKAEDVQDQGTDIDSLIESKKASVDRVRDLLADATNLDDIVSIEAELTAREGELASLEAQKRSLDDEVSYSTITLSIMTPAAAPEPVEEGPDGFWEGLVVGWHGFVAALGVLVTLLGVLLPFLVALAIPVAAVWWFLRRWRAKHPKPAAVPAFPPRSGAPRVPAAVDPGGKHETGKPGTAAPPATIRPRPRDKD